MGRPDSSRADGGGDSCVAAAETCNGVDDDCDGEVDEGVTRACGLDVGACSHGTETCEAGAWLGTCAGEVAPAPAEICEGSVDENCDGSVDEGCACTPGATQICGSDVGACTAGMQSCGAGAVWGDCVGAVGPSSEVCEGSVDEDCNGTVDDGCTCTNGAMEPCAGGTNAGICSRGTQTCASGAWGACAGRVNPGAEVCDGVRDEDCDGVVDNGCTCTNGAMEPCAGGTNAGICSRGTQTCGSGAWGACAGRVNPGAEVCDGVRDEDCDGVVDNGCACTNGATQSCTSASLCGMGTQTCVAGAWNTCSGPGTAVESCDGIDNNCNGSIDEGGVCDFTGCTWAEHGGHAYLACDPGTSLEWDQARLACEALGYHLVQIETNAENTWVRDAFGTGGPNIGDFWIGLSDSATEDTFLWLDGSSACNTGKVTGPPYCHWRGGRPDGGTGQNCVFQDVGRGTGEWNDDGCRNTFPFVCEAP